MTSRRTALLACCCVLGGMLIGQNWVELSARAGAGVLAQPAEWVPFSADVELVQPDGRKFHGSFARSSNGSTRLQLTLDGTEQTSINIHNIGQVRYYLGGGSTWTAGPMDLPVVGYKPRMYRTGMRGLTPHGRKLDLLKGGSRSVQSKSGLDAYHYVTPSGTVWLLAPALNFEPLVKVFLNGMRLELSEIVMGEPDPALFVPPPSASVTFTNVVAGMRRRTPGAGGSRSTPPALPTK